MFICLVVYLFSNNLIYLCKMKRFFALMLLIISINNIYSQNEESELDICVDKISNTQIKKIYAKAKNYKKYDYSKRVSFFKQAIEIDEECILCIWELAKLSFRKRSTDGEELDFPKKYFLILESLCPNYHADLYYYLSLIYYSETNDCKSVEYFNKFLDFNSENESKLAMNYKEQVSTIEATLPVAEFYCDFYSKPVSFNPFLLRNVSTVGKNEFLPIISPDNEHIYYTREYEYKALGDVMTSLYQDFSVSKRSDVNQEFDKGEALPPPFNVGSKYGGASISIDNHELYICACLQNGAYMNCDIYTTKYEFIEKGENIDTAFYSWTPLVNLGPNINGPQSWEAQPSLSADGNTLYFASARPGGKGSVDIYYSIKQEDGSWGKAENIGSPINTPESDKSPFIHTDSKTLYFASKVSDYRLGAGGFDIYYSRQGENGVWSQPENIGYPINNEGDEEAIVVSADGHYAYYSSERKDIGIGGKDIFYFTIPEKARPDKIVILKGSVDTENIESIKDAKLQVRTESDSIYEQSIKIKDDGSFIAIANIGKGDEDVVLEIQKEGKAFESKLIKKEESNNTFIKEQEFEIKDIEKGSAHTIDDILFATNSSLIEESSKIVLNAFASWLLNNNDINIEIQGHTDDVGSNTNNMALSKDRAFTVMQYLISKGIELSRLKFKGYGEDKPKFPNDSNINRARNRRTDFLIL